MTVMSCRSVCRKLRIIQRPVRPADRTPSTGDMIAAHDHASAEDRRRLGRHGRDAVPRPAATRCRSTAAATLHPIRIAYETYGTLSPARDNVILVCHALSGDAHAAGFATTPPPESTRDGFARRGARRPARPRPRLVGRHDRSRQGLRHRSLLRRQHQPARRLPRHDRAVVDEPGDRPAVRIGLSGHHRRRHGARRARVPRRARHRRGSPRSPADRSAACRRSSGRSCYPDQVDAIVAIASTHALQPQGVAWNAIARNAITADPDWQGGHYYGTGRAPNAGMGVARMVGHITYLSAKSLGDKFGRRLQFADDIRYTLTEPEFEVESYLRHQADSLRQALRREHLPLHVAGADLLRPRAAVRRRHAWPTRCATCRRARCSSRSAPTGCIRRRAPRSSPRRFARSARTSSST